MFYAARLLAKGRPVPDYIPRELEGLSKLDSSFANPFPLALIASLSKQMSMITKCAGRYNKGVNISICYFVSLSLSFFVCFEFDFS